jgi:hypothetical protein
MKVKRIVSNVATSDVGKASAFYHDVLGLELMMDLGWIRTYGLDAKMTIQVSVAAGEGLGLLFRTCRLRSTILRRLCEGSGKLGSQSNTAQRVSGGGSAGFMSGILSAS